MHDHAILVSSKSLADNSDIAQLTELSPVISTTSIISVREEEEEEEEDGGDEEEEEDVFHSSGAWRILGIMSELTDNALVIIIEWLHSKSIYYYYLLEKHQLEESQGLHHVPPLSDDLHLVPAVPATDEEAGRGGQTTLPTERKSITLSADDVISHDEMVFYNKERVYRAFNQISQRPMELLQALYHAILANTNYICYILIVVNVMVNGSVLALVYAALMFLWGLLSIPWPTKRFWLTLIFYTMFVVLVKYGFQFQQVDWSGSPDAGLYWPRVLGIEKKHNFFKNAVWDILLLIFLFVHRGMLHVSWTYLSVC